MCFCHRINPVYHAMPKEMKKVDRVLCRYMTNLYTAFTGALHGIYFYEWKLLMLYQTIVTLKASCCLK